MELPRLTTRWVTRLPDHSPRSDNFSSSEVVLGDGRAMSTERVLLGSSRTVDLNPAQHGLTRHKGILKRRRDLGLIHSSLIKPGVGKQIK